MSFQRLRSHLKSIDIEAHIIAGRKGNKENIKSKIIVPILQTIGWNLLRDMDFDHQGLDIVLFKDDKPVFGIQFPSQLPMDFPVHRAIHGPLLHLAQSA